MNRRSVLKATGAALGVGLGATGTAVAASCSKVEVQNDYVLLEGSDSLGECVGDAVGPTVEAGTEHDVYETCEDLDDTTYYQVQCSPERWIGEQHAECIERATPPPCFDR